MILVWYSIHLREHFNCFWLSYLVPVKSLNFSFLGGWGTDRKFRVFAKIPREQGPASAF